MRRYRVIRIKTVVTAEVYEVEGKSAKEAAKKEGQYVMSLPVDESHDNSAIVPLEGFDFGWLRDQMAKIGE